MLLNICVLFSPCSADVNANVHIPVNYLLLLSHISVMERDWGDVTPAENEAGTQEQHRSNKSVQSPRWKPHASTSFQKSKPIVILLQSSNYHWPNFHKQTSGKQWSIKPLSIVNPFLLDYCMSTLESILVMKLCDMIHAHLTSAPIRRPVWLALPASVAWLPTVAVMSVNCCRSRLRAKTVSPSVKRWTKVEHLPFNEANVHSTVSSLQQIWIGYFQ